MLCATATAASVLIAVAPNAEAHTPHPDIFGLAVSPQFATDNTILTISRGLLLRSTDRGATWQRIVNGIDNREQLYSVDFAGGVASRAYAASGDGLFRSNDGGITWSRTSGTPSTSLRLIATSDLSPEVALVAGAVGSPSFTDSGGSSWRSLADVAGPVTAAAFSPTTGAVLIVGDAAGSIHVSRDGAQTWTRHALGAVGAITAVAFPPTFATDGVALIGTTSGGILRWDDATQTATPMGVGLTDPRVTSIAYSAQFADDRMVFATTWTAGAFVSQDSGATWSLSNAGLRTDSQPSTPAYANRPNFSEVTSVPLGAGKPLLVIGSFTGLYSSSNGAASWQGIETLSSGILVGLALSPQFATDGKVAVTTYINGAHVSSDGGSSWSPSNLGLAQRSLWAARSDRFARLYGISYAPPSNGVSWMFTASTVGVLRSRDGGASWTPTIVPGYSSGVDAETPRVPYVLVSPSFATDRTVVLVDGGTGAVFRSTDEGASFVSIGLIPRRPNCLQASPTFVADRRLMACTSSGVYVSTDLGASWTATKALPSSVIALAVSVRTGVSETWFAATTRGLYRSDNRGTSWTIVSLPSVTATSAQVGAVAASPPSTGLSTILVSVRGRGLFRSIDGGASFAIAAPELLQANEQLDNYNYKPTAVPIVFSPAFATDRTVFGYSNDHLFRSTDAGVTWQRMIVPLAVHTGRFPVPPGAPTIGVATRGNRSISQAFTAGSDGGSPVLHFDATCTSTDGGAPGTASGLTNPLVVSVLTNGKTYTCTVSATNALGTSASSVPSSPIVPARAPTAPLGVSAIGGNGQATVSWSAPSNAGGLPITSYVVTPYIGYYPLAAQTFGSAATTQTVAGLTNGVTYRFKVAAVNDVGTGSSSSATNPVVPAPTVPGAPTILSAVGGDRQATVAWTAPANDGGSPILGYVLMPYVGFTAQTSRIFMSTDTTRVVTGLTNGVTYRFKVSAITAIGVGPVSATSNAVTPSA